MNLKTLFLGTICGAALMAAPGYELVPGLSTTRVALAPGFVTALTTLGVTPGGLEAGNLVAASSGVTATFQIPSARVDFSNLRLQILHTGGLSLRAGSITVILSDFVIENFAAGPRLTGLVKVNDTIVGRLPLFSITLGGAPEIKSFDAMEGAGTVGTIAVSGRLTLTADAARALNATFGVSAFMRDLVIGEATIRGTYIDGEM
jgi:hypothetical protein